MTKKTEASKQVSKGMDQQQKIPHYASFKARFVSFLLDYLLIGAYILVLLVVAFFLASGPLRGAYQLLFSNPSNSEISAFLLLTLPVILYFAFSESSSAKATWGKKRMQIEVVRNTADITAVRKVGLARSLLRSSVKFLPWELAHYLLWQIPGWPFHMRGASPPPSIEYGFGILYALVLVYFISVIFGKTHRSVYDRVAGTAVIHLHK